jgi:hypothetical protein
MRAAGFGIDQGRLAKLEASNSGPTGRSTPESRQKFFIEALHGALQILRSDVTPSKEELDAVFKIGASFDFESTVKISGMVSQLCLMPKGRELLLKLFRKARYNGFQVPLEPTEGPTAGSFCVARFPEMRGQQPIVQVNIGISLFDGEWPKVPFLTFDGQDYGMAEVAYPPFLALAHEFGHLVHSMDTYKALRDKYGSRCPPLPPGRLTIAEAEEFRKKWLPFAQWVCKNTGFPEPPSDSNVYLLQSHVHEACANEKLNDIIWSKLGATEDNGIMVEAWKQIFFTSYYPAEEMLNIMVDPDFNDGIFFEDARGSRLLPPGAIPETLAGRPLFRFSHEGLGQTANAFIHYGSDGINQLARALSPLFPEALRPPPGLPEPRPPRTG